MEHEDGKICPDCQACGGENDGLEKRRRNPGKRGSSLPALFRVNELIMGWQIALTRMHEGDTWEVYIPAKWGYGAMKMDDIPAYSTLIFTMTLVKIER